MTKKLDRDLKVLKACVRAIKKSSCERMVKANVEYLYDRFVRHPPKRATAEGE